MSIFFSLILLLIFTWIGLKDPFKTKLSPKRLFGGIAIKLGFAALFILIFTQYYTNGQLYGDTANFFKDGAVLAEYGKSDPAGYAKLLFGLQADNHNLMTNELVNTNIWSYGDNGDFINDNRLIIRINSVLHLFSGHQVWVHSLFFALLSFCGTLLIYKTFSELVKSKFLLFFGLLSFPTLAFWGSGISKEAVFVFGLGIFFIAIQRLYNKQRTFSGLLILIIGCGILLFNKPHVGLVLIPLSAYLFFFLNFNASKRNIGIASLSLIACFIVLSFTPSKINLVDKISYKQQDISNLGHGGIFFITDSSFCAFDFEYLDHFDYNSIDKKITVLHPTEGEYKLFGQSEFKQFSIEPSTEVYDVYHVLAPSKSTVDVPLVNYSGTQLIKNIPIALLNVFARPFLTDPGSLLKIPLFIENMLFLGFIALVFIKRRKLSNEERAWSFYLIAAALILVLIIGWTTPVLGAIARYKMAPYLLLFIALCIHLKPISKPKS